MGQKVDLIKENTAVLLYNKKEHKWIDGTKSISAVFTAYYYGISTYRYTKRTMTLRQHFR